MKKIVEEFLQWFHQNKFFLFLSNNFLIGRCFLDKNPDIIFQTKKCEVFKFPHFIFCDFWSVFRKKTEKKNIKIRTKKTEEKRPVWMTIKGKNMFCFNLTKTLKYH